MEPIATIQTHFPLAVYIFGLDGDTTVTAAVGSAWTDSKDCVENVKPRKYKMYHAVKRGYYFKWNNRRLYLDEAIRTNW